MSVSLDWFYSQDKTTQTKLLAYEWIRGIEELELIKLQTAVAGAARGIF